MLVLPSRASRCWWCPALEAPRVPDAGDLFAVVPWADAEDPDRPGRGRCSAASGRRGRAPAGRLRPGLGHHRAGPPAPPARRRWIEASAVTSPIRAVKDAARARPPCGRPVRPPTGWPPCCRAARSPSSGGTEAQVSAAARRPPDRRGPQPGQLRHRRQRAQRRQPAPRAGPRVIGPGETVVCDFGGTYSLDGDVGYCSDITRTVVTGPPVGRGRASATRCCWRPSRPRWRRPGPGSTAEHGRPGGPGHHRRRRLRARTSSTAPATASASRSTRTPTWWRATSELLRPGHAFSVEPGIYLPDRFGMRLEDIVVIGEDGAPKPLNSADHGLVVVDA